MVFVGFEVENVFSSVSSSFVLGLSAVVGCSSLLSRVKDRFQLALGVMRHSKKVSSFELYKLNPLSPHCGSIARELVHCYTWGRLRIVTVRGNTPGRHS